MKKLLFKSVAFTMGMSMILSSCSTPTDSGAVKEPTKEVTGEKAPETNEVKEANLSVEVFDRGDLPSPSTAENNPVANWLKEKVKKDLNINLTLVPIPRSQELEKLNVMMAGNSAPDIVFSYNVVAASDYAKNGGLTDLTASIDEFGTNIKKELSEQLPYGVFYDKQFAIPAKRIDEDLKHSTWIRQDILEKYNLSIPTTRAEFYTALTTIKANEPDLIPYAMGTTKNERYYENIVMSYVNYKDEKEFYTYNSDNTRLLSPGTKEGFREINKWYNEGLISTDFALDDNFKQFEADIANGKAFSFSDDLGRPQDLFGTAFTEVEGLNYTVTNTFENSKGEYFYNKYAPIGMYIMVPKASEKNAGTAVRYLDWMLQDDIIDTIKLGKDLGYSELNKDGVLEYIKNPAELEAMGVKTSLFSDLGIIQSGIDYNDVAKFKILTKSKWKKGDWDGSPQVEAMFKAREGEGFYVTPQLPYITDADTKYGLNIRSSVKTMAAKLIACKPEEFDALWETEYNQLKAAGLDKVLEERAAAYDEMKK